MNEKLILKHISGEKLQKEELQILESSLGQNPLLIQEYRHIKNFLISNPSFYINDSIFILKNQLKIFSNLEIEKKSFYEKKAASIGQTNIFFDISLIWNDIDIKLGSELYSYKITIKTNKEEKEILLINSEIQLFHIVLAQNKEFTYTFNDSNVVLSSDNKNLGIFIR